MTDSILEEMLAINREEIRLYEKEIRRSGFLLRSIFDQRLEHKPILLLGINPGSDVEDNEALIDQRTRDAFARHSSKDLSTDDPTNPYASKFRDLIRLAYSDSLYEARIRDTFYLNMCLFGSENVRCANNELQNCFKVCEQLVYRIIDRVAPIVVITHSCVWDSYRERWGIVSAEAPISLGTPGSFCRADNVTIGRTVVKRLLCIPHWTGSFGFGAEVLERTSALLREHTADLL